MSNILPLTLPAVGEPIAEPQLQARVRLYSRALAAVLTGFAVLLIIVAGAVMLAMLAYRGDGLQIGPTGMWLGTGQGPPGYIAFASLPLHHRLIYIAVGVARTTPAVLILLNLGALFRLYGKRVVFGRANALRLRNVGLWLVLDAVAPFLLHLILSATGYEIDKAWMHMASLQALVIGAIVFVIAEVMKVGREIEEDRSQFV